MHHRPHWSYSAVSQYMACPLRFYFQRIVGIPQMAVGSSLVLGSSVHHALAVYHQDVRDNAPTKPESLHHAVVEAWDRREPATRVLYRSGETRDGAIAQGIALIEAYLKEPPPQQIIGIEQEMIAPLHNSRGEYLETPLVAVADLITEDNEELKLHEFKTSGRTYSAMDAETSLQPTCYVNAAKEVFGHHASVEYTVLVKTKVPKIQRLVAARSDSDLGRLGDLVETVERAVSAGIFYPVESPLNCSTCPYRKPCRDWGSSPNAGEVVTIGLPNHEEAHAHRAPR